MLIIIIVFNCSANKTQWHNSTWCSFGCRSIDWYGSMLLTIWILWKVSFFLNRRNLIKFIHKLTYAQIIFCISMGTNKILPSYDIFHPLTSSEDRDKRYKKWQMAVDRASLTYAHQSWNDGQKGNGNGKIDDEKHFRDNNKIECMHRC